LLRPRKTKEKPPQLFLLGFLLSAQNRWLRKLEHLAQAYRHIAELKSHTLRQRVMLKHVSAAEKPASRWHFLPAEVTKA
jgi:hypothetical protein